MQDAVTSLATLISVAKPKLSWSKLLDVPKTPAATTTATNATTCSTTTNTNTNTLTTTNTTNANNTTTMNAVRITTSRRSFTQEKEALEDKGVTLSKELLRKPNCTNLISYSPAEIDIESVQENFHKLVMSHIESLRSNFLTNIQILSTRIDIIDQRITQIMHFVNNNNNSSSNNNRWNNHILYNTYDN
ncbi:unnamed protein product [Trichobilharzia regenti]|nr:unnamed protein product [Trichobilharzia regenti]